MARKAKASPGIKPPPLDDPEPPIAEHKLRTERVGNPSLAATDLYRGLKQGLPSMSRRTVDGVPELTRDGYWDDHALAFETGAFGLHGLQIVPLRWPDGTDPASARRSVTDRVFFIWEPTSMAHVKKLEPVIDNERGKPGRRPKTKWKLHVAAELCRTGIESKQNSDGGGARQISLEEPEPPSRR